MAIESRNPATGERVRSYPEMEPQVVAGILGEAHRQFERWRRVPATERAALDGARRRRARRPSRALRAADGRGDGQAHPPGARRGGEVRLVLPLLRRGRPGLRRAQAGRHRRDPQLRRLRADRRRARGDAVELPVLAGVPVRGSRAGGGQRRGPQARFERPRLRARDRGGVRGGRISRKVCSARC